MVTYLGIDDGNFDTKSKYTRNPNGYTSHNELPPMAREYLKYDGKYYVSTTDRFNYMEDKTASERGLILSLFGIAKELLYRAEKNGLSGQAIQDYLLTADNIVLGVGLPPLHWKKHEEKKQYYYDKMQNGIEYEYMGYRFSHHLLFCDVFPQDYAAIVTNARDKAIAENQVVYGADIGGGTMDIVPVIDGKPAMTQCTTENVGIMWMYRHIISTIKLEHSITVKATDIENVLLGKKTLLPENVKSSIIREVQAWVDEKIIGTIVQSGVNVDTEVVVFLGGGALLLKPFIMNDRTIKHKHFFPDQVAVHANATGYEKLVKQTYKKYKASIGK